MHMKKALCVCLSLAIAGSVFAGCSREQTPEEIEAASLAAVTQEEQTTGMKRLDSPNLTDYEKPLANFVSGIQAKDAAKIATALGSVNIFGDTLDGWIVSNNYESLQTEDLHDIKIQSSKDGKVATINVFFEEPMKIRVTSLNTKAILTVRSGISPLRPDFLPTIPFMRLSAP